MQLSVPFIPDETYATFLNDNSRHLASVYFPLYSGPVLDARLRFNTTPLPELIRLLSRIGAPDKYCLLNTRFILPDQYLDPAFVSSLLNTLEQLVSNRQLTGIVFNDFYFLNALALEKKYHSILSRIEAVPGVNTMITSPDQIEPLFDMIEKAGFRLPSKIIADRSLNRDLEKLEHLHQFIRQQFTDMRIELIANEGCIYHCPFKLSHDALIALGNTGCARDRTHQINTRIGCHAYFFNRPERFLKSPFIRPEDLVHYQDRADSIKICGRTLGVRFLTTVIESYIKRSFDGNLLDIMDAASWMSDGLHIDNKRLDPGFFDLISSCTKRCKACRICKDLFGNAAVQKPLTIKTFKDSL
jgi:hypothetical protein